MSSLTQISSIAKPVSKSVGRPPYPDMVWIEGGTFQMGSDDHYPEEAPAHVVCRGQQSPTGHFRIDRGPASLGMSLPSRSMSSLLWHLVQAALCLLVFAA